MTSLDDAPQLRQLRQLSSDLPAPNTKQDSEAAYTEIRSSLATTTATGLRIDELFRLRRIVAMAVLEGSMPEVVHTAVSAIFDATKQMQVVKPLSDSQAWKQAFSAALSNSIHWDIGKHHRETFSREVAVVEAFKRLDVRGYSYRITDRGLVLQEKAFTRLASRIDKLVMSLGGREVVDNIFAGQIRSNRYFDGAFLGGRNVQPVPSRRPPSIPWHYLYQLATKHIRHHASSRNAAADWALVIELARDLCATIDVEPYSSFEGMDVVASGLQDNLQDLVLFDEMFAFHQWQPKYAPTLIDDWIRAMEDQGYEIEGGLSSWRTFAGAVIATASDTRSLLVDADTFAALPPGANWFFKRLARGSATPNQEYKTPLDAVKRTSPYIPVYHIPPNRYWLPPRSLLVRSLYEWIYKELRQNASAALETAMGIALERLTEASLGRCNGTGLIAARKYKSSADNKTYEVDLVLETADRIFLIECKKKPLTNAARSGQPLFALVDLTASLLSMLLQLVRHENELRGGGRITFLDGSVLDLAGRSIEKIAVTALDHGSLQDRMFIGSIMRGLFGRQVRTNSSEHNQAVDKINKTLSELTKQFTGLAGIATSGDVSDALHHHAIETWWLSIDMLQYLCHQSNDLWAALHPLRHLSFRTGHLMTEIAYSKGVKAQLERP